MQKEFRIEEKSDWEGLIKGLCRRDGGKRRHEGVGHMLVWREEVGKEGRGIGRLLGTSGREGHGL